MNITVHHSTGYTPQELHFGTREDDQVMDIIQYPPSKPIGRGEMIIKARENLERSFDMRKKQQQRILKIELRVGDLVLLRDRHLSNASNKVTHKFFYLFEGPYEII